MDSQRNREPGRLNVSACGRADVAEPGAPSGTIILYSPQSEAVWRAVTEDGAAYSRREYVAAKYEECADIFLTAYDAYIREAEKIVPRPDDRAYPYWAFASMENVDLSGGSRVMTLSVPISEVVFFDQYDWYKVLRLSYIGENEADEAVFTRNLELRGIRDASDAVLKPFYPDVKREIIGSWKRLFRYDSAIRTGAASGIRAGDTSGGRTGAASGVRAVQAGLWRIKKDWLQST